MQLMTETVQLRVAGEPTGAYDDYGNEIIGPPRDESWRAWFEPRTSSEDTSDGAQQVYGYWLFLPLEAPLSGADAVLINGVEYQVVGEPGVQPGGFVVEGYQKAAVEKVTG